MATEPNIAEGKVKEEPVFELVEPLCELESGEGNKVYVKREPAEFKEEIKEEPEWTGDEGDCLSKVTVEINCNDPLQDVPIKSDSRPDDVRRVYGAMERLIENVRKFPCLWKTDIEEYKLYEVKEAAWREVVKECDLSDVKEAKDLWRKLRDGHRQAIRKKTGQAANPKNLWKYEKVMEFLLPTMQNRSRSTNATQASRQDSDVTQRNEDSSESEQHQNVDDFVPPKKKLNLKSLETEHKRREIRSADRDSLRRQSLSSSTTNIVENTALEKFFMSMLLTTNNLSETLQLRVQRQVFNIVMEAKEEDIANRRLAASSANLATIVHDFRGDTSVQQRHTPHYNVSTGSTSTLSNYSDVPPSPSTLSMGARSDVGHRQNDSLQFSPKLNGSFTHSAMMGD